MPRDVIAPAVPETTLRRRQLCEALRGRLPEGFEWDYETSHDFTDCGTAGCAMGLMWEMWPSCFPSRPTGFEVECRLFGSFIGLDHASAVCAFFDADRRFERDTEEVTPAMVADYIEELAGDK